MSRKKKAVGFRYTPNESKAVQDLARHQMIEKLLADILADLVVCKLEGWDSWEYSRLLRDAIPVPPDEKAETRRDRNA
jgi:hypothetical protein